MGINPVMTSSSGQMFGSPQRQALPWLPSQTFTDLVGACSYLAMAGRGRSARAQRNRSRHSNQDRDHETLKVSIRQSGDTTVTEGQQSLPASNTNRPVYSIAVKPLAVEADLTVNPHGHRPGWANDRAYRSTATVAKGQTSATWGSFSPTRTRQSIRLRRWRLRSHPVPNTRLILRLPASNTPSTMMTRRPVRCVAPRCGKNLLTRSSAPVHHHHFPVSRMVRGGCRCCAMRCGTTTSAAGGALASQTYTTVDGLADNQGGGFADTRGQQHRPRDIPQYQYQTMAGDFFRDSLTTLKLKFK